MKADGVGGQTVALGWLYVQMAQNEMSKVCHSYILLS